jgi:hypothetical protein
MRGLLKGAYKQKAIPWKPLSGIPETIHAGRSIGHAVGHTGHRGKSLDCKETQAGYPPRMVKRTRLARKLCLLSPCYWGKLRLQQFSAYGFGYSRFWKVLLPKVGYRYNKGSYTEVVGLIPF